MAKILQKLNVASKTCDGVHWATTWENLLMLYANNKGADQPAHLRSLISTFVVRCLQCLDSIIPLVSISEILSLYLASEAEQPGLSLTWSQTPKTVFSWRGSIQSASIKVSSHDMVLYENNSTSWLKNMGDMICLHQKMVPLAMF